MSSHGVIDMVNEVETGFYLRTNEWVKIYAIENSINELVAIVWRRYTIEQKHTFQSYLRIDYDLQYISGKKFSKKEMDLIGYYYHNLVRTLTDDIQTIYTDNIEERMQLPFYQNLLHIKVVKD